MQLIDYGFDYNRISIEDIYEIENIEQEKTPLYIYKKKIFNSIDECDLSEREMTLCRLMVKSNEVTKKDIMKWIDDFETISYLSIKFNVKSERVINILNGVKLMLSK